MMDDLRKKYYVCIDIGGTAIKYGLANENGVYAASIVKTMGHPA